MTYKDLAKKKARDQRYKTSAKARAAAKRYADSHKEERKVWLAANSVHVSEQNRDYYLTNRERQLERSKAWQRVHPGWWRERKHGITNDRWLQMLRDQDNKCAICGIDFQGRKPCLDHDHATGRIRGALCSGCNARLGWYEKRRGIVEGYLR